MGRTPASKRLRIGVDPAIRDWPEWAALAEKGHEIVDIGPGCDIVMGPTCWRMCEELRKYLDVALKAARKAREATR